MRAVHLVPAGVVLVALGAIGGAAQLGHLAATPRPVSSPAAIRQVPVTAAARACPPAPGGAAAPVALLAGGAAAGGTGATGQGQVELTALPPAGVPVHAAAAVRAQSPGALSVLTLPAAKATGKQATTQAAQGWSVAGGGALAQGLEAELTQDSGLASVRCAEPGSAQRTLARPESCVSSASRPWARAPPPATDQPCAAWVVACLPVAFAAGRVSTDSAPGLCARTAAAAWTGTPAGGSAVNSTWPLPVAPAPPASSATGAAAPPGA